VQARAETAPEDVKCAFWKLPIEGRTHRRIAGYTHRSTCPIGVPPSHDNRHTLITELAESGAGDETIMEIAGHVSRQMLSRYSHIRMEAKRKALAEVDRQRAADKAQREKGRATAQAKRNGARVANVAQTLPIQ
jgi:hypothetical protein